MEAEEKPLEVRLAVRGASFRMEHHPLEVGPIVPMLNPIFVPNQFSERPLPTKADRRCEVRGKRKLLLTASRVEDQDNDSRFAA